MHRRESNATIAQQPSRNRHEVVPPTSLHVKLSQERRPRRESNATIARKQCNNREKIAPLRKKSRNRTIATSQSARGRASYIIALEYHPQERRPRREKCNQCAKTQQLRNSHTAIGTGSCLLHRNRHEVVPPTSLPLNITRRSDAPVAKNATNALKRNNYAMATPQSARGRASYIRARVVPLQNPYCCAITTFAVICTKKPQNTCRLTAVFGILTYLLSK